MINSLIEEETGGDERRWEETRRINNQQWFD